MIKRLKDWMFNEKEWREIQGMDDQQLKWEYCRLLSESKEGQYDIHRFRRICQRMAARFEAQDDFR